MNKIWDILHRPDTVVFFDIDGTLTSYNYGVHHAHHELDGKPEFRDVNIYADCVRLEPLYEYIKGHDVNRLFCISREPHGHEGWKSEMVERLYGIPKDHCFYTLEARNKPAIVVDKVKELFPDISPESVVLMDDNDDTLGMYMAQTPFCTAHPMLFMEKQGGQQDLHQSANYSEVDNNKLWGKTSGGSVCINLDDLLYLESVDDKLFAYTCDTVARIEGTLNSFMMNADDLGFFRCSKSMVINVNRVTALKSLSSNRIDATIEGGEHIIISRRYASDFRRLLKGDR